MHSLGAVTVSLKFSMTYIHEAKVMAKDLCQGQSQGLKNKGQGLGKMSTRIKNKDMSLRTPRLGKGVY